MLNTVWAEELKTGLNKLQINMLMKYL